MGQPVVHFEVHTQHSKALRSFYAELFGWKLAVVPDGSYALVDPDTAGVGIRGGIAQSGAGAAGVMFYIQVPDIQAHLERIQAAGGSVLVKRIESPQVTTAMFSDPDGNRVGLTEARP
ncbi:MAG: VOC family protein [Solirubrobacteraceae bacterium]